MKEISNGRNVTIDKGHQPKFGYGTYAVMWPNPGLGDTYYATDKLASFACYTSGTWTMIASTNIGLDAAKPASPIVGSVYVSTDTGREYTCFVSGYWVVTSSKTHERYDNHLGAVDNFTVTAVLGNGTATPDAANHKMSLSTGALLAGYALFRTKKTWNGTVNQKFSARIDNIVDGAGVDRPVQIGFCANFANPVMPPAALNAFIGFIYAGDGNWYTVTCDGLAGVTLNPIPAIANGDLLGIHADTNWGAIFSVNNFIVNTHITNIPPNGQLLYAGASVIATTNVVNPARSISVDYFGVEFGY